MGTPRPAADDGRTADDATSQRGEEPANHATKLGLAGALLIALFSLCLLLVNINGVVLSRHEVLAAQPAREMLSDGHWIVPTIAGEFRVNKPPTMGWLIAASMSVFRSHAEWVARLPAILSGVVICLLVASMTARHLGRRAGLLTGLLTATSFFILLQSRLSEADMPMAMCVTLAFWVLGQWGGRAEGGRLKDELKGDQAMAGIHPSSFLLPPSVSGPVANSLTVSGSGEFAEVRVTRWSILFYSAVGFSFLLKGVGPIFILPAALLYAWLARDRRAKRILLNPFGLAVLFVLLVAWPLAAWKTYPGIIDAWKRETVQRATGELGEQIGKSDPLLLYFYSIPMMLLPWFPLAVVGAIAGLRAKWHRRPLGLMLLCWFGCGFVLLNCIAWKHNHYSIPILPACMPAAAVGLIVWLRHNYSLKNPRHAIAAIAWTVACAIAVGVVLKLRPDGAADIAMLIGLLGVGGLALILLEHFRKQSMQVAAMFLLAWLVIAGVFWRISPQHDGYRTSAELGRRVTNVVPVDATVTLLGLGEHQITYYIDRKMRRIDNIVESTAPLQSLPRPAYILAPASAAEALAKLGTVESPDRDATINKRQTEADRTTLFVLR